MKKSNAIIHSAAAFVKQEPRPVVRTWCGEERQNCYTWYDRQITCAMCIRCREAATLKVKP